MESLLSTLDRHLYGKNRRSHHPGQRVLLGAAGLLNAALPLPYYGPLSVFLFFTALILVKRIPLSLLFRLFSLPLGFLILGALPFFWETTLYPWPPQLRFHPGGWERLEPVLLRSLASVAVLLYLTLAVSIHDLLYLLQRMGVPAVVRELMLLIYRFIFILEESRHTIRIAQESRLGYGSLRQRYRSTAMLMGRVWADAFLRAREMERALRSRGGEGELRVLAPSVSLSPGWILAGAAGELLFLAGAALYYYKLRG